MSKISSDLIRGHINTIILRTLYDSDKYGLEIMKVVKERSGGVYEIKQPTLYSSLTRLTKQGYIKSYWGGSEAGGRRKYFTLTDSGKTAAEQNMSEWEYSRTVIDKLISEKEFDLKSPAPTSVDFSLLTKSVTKTTMSSENTIKHALEPKTDELNLRLVDEKLKNFKKYESERENKDKLENLFKKTLDAPENTQTEKFQAETKNTPPLDIEKPISQSKINFDELIAKSEQDNIRLKICTSRHIKALSGVFFNKGLMLLYCFLIFSAIVGAQLFVVYHFLGNKLDLSKNYLAVFAAVFVAISLIILIATLFGYGKNTHRESAYFSYSSAFILAINVCLVYFACALLLKLEISNAAFIKHILLPAAIIMQLPLAAVIYNKIFTKN